MKKIGAIVSLSLIGALIITTICLALIPFNYMMNISTPDIISVYKDGVKTTYLKDVESDEFDQIYKLLTNGFKVNVMSAIFNGNLNKSELVIGQTRSTSLNSGTKVMFEYNTPQVLKDGNKDYNNGEVTYEYLVFEVSETNDLTLQKCYIASSDVTSSYVNYKNYYETMCNFSELYDYINI